MVKHHLSQKSERKWEETPNNEGEEIPSLYEKIKQQSEYSQIVIKIKKSYQWDNIKVETTKHTTDQNHNAVSRVNWITSQCISKQLPSKLKNRSPKAQQRT